MRGISRKQIVMIFDEFSPKQKSFYYQSHEIKIPYLASSFLIFMLIFLFLLLYKSSYSVNCTSHGTRRAYVKKTYPWNGP